MLDANGNQIIGTQFSANSSSAPGVQNTGALAGNSAVFSPATNVVQTPGCAIVLPFGNTNQITPYVPKPSYAVDGQSLVQLGAGFFTDTFSNTGATPQNIVFSPMLGISGNYAPLNQQPNASDSPAIQDSFGSNVQKLQGGNIRAQNVPVIVSQFQVTTTRVDQFQQNWTFGYFDANLNFISTSQLTPLCSPCNNTNQPGIFQQIQNGPFEWGGNSVAIYPILGAPNVETPNIVTISAIISGQARTGNFTPNC